MALLKKVVKKIKMALFKEVSRREMEKEDGETKYFMKKENTFIGKTIPTRDRGSAAYEIF